MKSAHKIWLLIFLVFCMIWLIPHSVPNYDGDTDFPWNFVPAVKGEHVDQFHGFVYTYTLKVFHEVWGDWMMSGRMISALSMALSLFFIFQLTGWTGVILLLISPLFWWCSYHLTTDSLAWLFMCGAYWGWCDGCWINGLSKFNNSSLGVNIFFVLSGVYAGLAFCTRYPMILLLILTLFIPWRKIWLFLVPFLSLVGFQGFLNLRNGFGILGNNFGMNVMQKGTALNFGAILKNLWLFPIQFMSEMWPLFGIVLVLAFYELVRQKRWELIIIGVVMIGTVSLTFYSMRFFLPVMLPVLIGASLFIRRLSHEMCDSVG